MPIALKDVKGVPNGSLRKVKIGLNREALKKLIESLDIDNLTYNEIIDSLIAKENKLLEVKE